MTWVNKTPLPEKTLLYYTEGHCDEFAAALSLNFGWPVEMGYYVSVSGGGFNVSHTWCADGDTAVDASGRSGLDKMRRTNSEHCNFERFQDAKELKAFLEEQGDNVSRWGYCVKRARNIVDRYAKFYKGI